MEELAKVFGVDWKLLLVQLINFGILLFILQRFFYKPLLKMIDDRKAIVEKGVGDAQEAKVALEKAGEESSLIVDGAKKEARDYLNTTKNDAALIKEKIMADVEKEKERVLKEATIAAKRMEEEAILKSKESISKMAVLAAEKILKEKHQ